MKADKRASTSKSATASVRQAKGGPSLNRTVKRATRKATQSPQPTRAGSSMRGKAIEQRPVTAAGQEQPPPGTLRIPPLLLEKEPPPVHARGSATDASIGGAQSGPGVRPQLDLTPRDPHWLHAHWDFSTDELRDAAARSEGGQLALRLFEHSPAGRLVSETRVRPEAARWFVHVEQAGTAYAGQIGYYDRARKWVPLASSSSVRTPPNGPTAHGGFELATLTRDGTLERHGTSHALVPPWSAEREAALHALARGGSPEFSGSESFLQAASGVSSPGSASWGAPSSFSSLINAAPQFRLEVNAELIVYGATEPDAELTVGGRHVALEPDGSFRLRFTLPDGDHDLPVHARSARNSDERSAMLEFSRRTALKGEVGQHPQEPGLQPPG